MIVFLLLIIRLPLCACFSLPRDQDCHELWCKKFRKQQRHESLLKDQSEILKAGCSNLVSKHQDKIVPNVVSTLDHKPIVKQSLSRCVSHSDTVNASGTVAANSDAKTHSAAGAIHCDISENCSNAVHCKDGIKQGSDAFVSCGSSTSCGLTAFGTNVTSSCFMTGHMSHETVLSSAMPSYSFQQHNSAMYARPIASDGPTKITSVSSDLLGKARNSDVTNDGGSGDITNVQSQLIRLLTVMQSQNSITIEEIAKGLNINIDGKMAMILNQLRLQLSNVAVEQCASNLQAATSRSSAPLGNDSFAGIKAALRTLLDKQSTAGGAIGTLLSPSQISEVGSVQGHAPRSLSNVSDSFMQSTTASVTLSESSRPEVPICMSSLLCKQNLGSPQPIPTHQGFFSPRQRSLLSNFSRSPTGQSDHGFSPHRYLEIGSVNFPDADQLSYNSAVRDAQNVNSGPSFDHCGDGDAGTMVPSTGQHLPHLDFQRTQLGRDFSLSDTKYSEHNFAQTLRYMGQQSVPCSAGHLVGLRHPLQQDVLRQPVAKNNANFQLHNPLRPHRHESNLALNSAEGCTFSARTAVGRDPFQTQVADSDKFHSMQSSDNTTPVNVAFRGRGGGRGFPSMRGSYRW